MDGPKLTLEQQETAFQAIRRLEQIFMVLTDLEECGEPCQVRRAEAKAAMEHLQAILKHFAPGTA